MAIYPGLTPKKWASAYVILEKMKGAGVFLPEGHSINALMTMTQPELMDYVGRVLGEQCKLFWTDRVPADLRIEIKDEERPQGGYAGGALVADRPLVLDRSQTIDRLRTILASCG